MFRHIIWSSFIFWYITESNIIFWHIIRSGVTFQYFIGSGSTFHTLLDKMLRSNTLLDQLSCSDTLLDQMLHFDIPFILVWIPIKGLLLIVAFRLIIMKLVYRAEIENLLICLYVFDSLYYSCLLYISLIGIVAWSYQYTIVIWLILKMIFLWCYGFHCSKLIPREERDFVYRFLSRIWLWSV